MSATSKLVGSRGSPAAAQRLRRIRAFGGLCEKFGQWDRQCLGKLVEQVDRRIFLPPLQPTHIRSIDPGVEREPFL